MGKNNTAVKLSTETYLVSQISAMKTEIVEKLDNIEKNVARDKVRVEDLNTVSIGLEHILNTLRLNDACKGE